MWRDDALLLDMLLASRRVATFNHGKTWSDFEADVMLQSATQYQLQIIGEAAGKVSAAVRAAHPDIPWPKIIAFRHRLVHDYPGIELPTVWSIVQDHVPPLITALEGIVPPNDASEEPP
jgi:uncharacterized protein with HEPN domain